MISERKRRCLSIQLFGFEGMVILVEWWWWMDSLDAMRSDSCVGCYFGHAVIVCGNDNPFIVTNILLLHWMIQHHQNLFSHTQRSHTFSNYSKRILAHTTVRTRPMPTASRRPRDSDMYPWRELTPSSCETKSMLRNTMDLSEHTTNKLLISKWINGLFSFLLLQPETALRISIGRCSYCCLLSLLSQFTTAMIRQELNEFAFFRKSQSLRLQTRLSNRRL